MSSASMAVQTIFVALVLVVSLCREARAHANRPGHVRAGHPHADITLSTHYHYQVGQCGLMNQHMKLLVLLTLAISLHADQVVLPSALSRDTFTMLKAQWVEEPASSLWDVDSIRQLLGAHGVDMTLAPRPAVLPKAAVQLDRRVGRNIHGLQHDVRKLVQGKLKALRHHQPADDKLANFSQATPQWLQWQQDEQQQQLAGSQSISKFITPRRNLTHPNTGKPTLPVYVHAKSLFWALDTRNLQLYTDVARAVQFNADLVAVADIMAARLRAMSPNKKFNGLHLRVENDWRVAKSQTNEGGDKDLDQCGQLMRAMNFSDGPLYVASAIFNTSTGQVDPKLCSVCLQWFNKEVNVASLANRHTLIKGLLPHGSLPAVLHSEQAALLDFLVLQRADQVVGFVESSFSFNLREYRALAGWPRHSMALVDVTAKQDVVAYFEKTATFNV